MSLNLSVCLTALAGFHWLAYDTYGFLGLALVATSCLFTVMALALKEFDQ